MAGSFIRELDFLSRVTTKRLRRHVALVIMVAILGSSLVSAQGTRGTISGTVTDANGAVIQEATVKLVDVAKGVEVRTVKCNSEGRYQFLEVEPAVYNLIVAASG